MALSYYPFDGQSTTESQYSQLFRELQDSGVVPDTAAAWQASADASGMTVKLQPGFAIVRGHAVLSTAVEIVTIVASEAQARTDRIVLRLDPTANTIVPVVIKGTAGGGIPALTQTDTGLYDLPIAQVAVAANATNIGTTAVADDRRYTGNRVGVWITSTRPANPRVGQMGLNTGTNAFEFWNGVAWTEAVPSSLTTRLTNAEATLNAGTSAKTANTLVKRGPGGRADFEFVTLANAPIGSTDAVNKTYADKMGETYYAESTGGNSLTTAPTAAATPCKVTVPVGTWDIDFQGKILFAVNDARLVRVHLYNGSTDVAVAEEAIYPGGTFSTMPSGFVRVTVSATTAFTIRTSTTLAGNSQSASGQAIRARRVPDGVTTVTYYAD